MELATRLDTFPGVGPAKAKALAKLGLETVGDLLTYWPRAYEDRTRIYAINDAPPGEAVCVSALVSEAPVTAYIRKGLSTTKCRVVDGSGSLFITFFNQ